MDGTRSLGDGDIIGVGSVKLTLRVLHAPSSTETEPGGGTGAHACSGRRGDLIAVTACRKRLPRILPDACDCRSARCARAYLHHPESLAEGSHPHSGDWRCVMSLRFGLAVVDRFNGIREPDDPADRTRKAASRTKAQPITFDCDPEQLHGAARLLCLVKRFEEGRRLFDEETFQGNGRTCVTCHSVDTGTFSPEGRAEAAGHGTPAIPCSWVTVWTTASSARRGSPSTRPFASRSLSPRASSSRTTRRRRASPSSGVRRRPSIRRRCNPSSCTTAAISRSKGRRSGPFTRTPITVSSRARSSFSSSRSSSERRRASSRPCRSSSSPTEDRRPGFRMASPPRRSAGGRCSTTCRSRRAPPGACARCATAGRCSTSPMNSTSSCRSPACGFSASTCRSATSSTFRRMSSSSTAPTRS